MMMNQEKFETPRKPNDTCVPVLLCAVVNLRFSIQATKVSTASLFAICARYNPSDKSHRSFGGVRKGIMEKLVQCKPNTVRPTAQELPPNYYDPSTTIHATKHYNQSNTTQALQPTHY